MTLRSILEASDQKHGENYWQSIEKKRTEVEAEITADGGKEHCLNFEPDLMRNLASLHLQNGDTFKAAEIYSTLWNTDTKNAGPGYSREFIEDALGLAGVYQAQGSHLHAVSAYKSIFEYDMRRLEHSDQVLARDFNNLGVAYYLAANTKNDTREAEKLYDNSKKMYQAALALADVKTAPFLVSTIKHNRTLTVRDYKPRKKP